jgi:RNA polymerase sigma-70 factor (ECF subfamily)
MTVAAVNSGLQRARSTLKGAELRSEALRELDAEADRRLVESYAEAFERYDVDKLLSLFAEQASLSMPPFTMWVRGVEGIGAFMEETRSHCVGSRLLPLRANGGCPAFAQYVPSDRPGVLLPWSIIVLELQRGRISHVCHFIDAALFDSFGMPAELEA